MRPGRLPGLCVRQFAGGRRPNPWRPRVSPAPVSLAVELKPATSPKKSALAIAATATNCRTAPPFSSGRPSAACAPGRSRASIGAAHALNPQPMAAPAPERIALSVSHCRMRRQRVAPREQRSAVSRDRAAPRASRRLATLAHAISRIRMTPPISSLRGFSNSARMSETPMPPGRTWIRCSIAMRLNPDSSFPP